MEDRLLQALLSGLALGSLYALVAQGYYITYTTTNIVNFAQGEFLMVGALIALSFYAGTRLFPEPIFGLNLRTVSAGGMPPLLVVVIVVPILALDGRGAGARGDPPAERFYRRRLDHEHGRSQCGAARYRAADLGARPTALRLAGA